MRSDTLSRAKVDIVLPLVYVTSLRFYYEHSDWETQLSLSKIHINLSSVYVISLRFYYGHFQRDKVRPPQVYISMYHWLVYVTSLQTHYELSNEIRHALTGKNRYSSPTGLRN